MPGLTAPLGPPLASHFCPRTRLPASATARDVNVLSASRAVACVSPAQAHAAHHEAMGAVQWPGRNVTRHARLRPGSLTGSLTGSLPRQSHRPLRVPLPVAAPSRGSQAACPPGPLDASATSAAGPGRARSRSSSRGFFRSECRSEFLLLAPYGTYAYSRKMIKRGAGTIWAPIGSACPVRCHPVKRRLPRCRESGLAAQKGS